jgi:ribosomal protein S27E
MPDAYSLEMAAKGLNDSFIIKVKCGNCSNEWTEALRYQNWTVVQCPQCGKKNSVDTKNYSAWLIN